MAKKYKVMGYHSRINADGEKTRYKPGDIIEATNFELAQFRNKFVAVPDVEVVEISAPEKEVDYTELDTAVDMANLYLENADKYDKDSIKRLKELIAKRPTKAETVAKLVAAINDMLEELAKVA